jgi:hypothetical protein
VSGDEVLSFLYPERKENRILDLMKQVGRQHADSTVEPGLVEDACLMAQRDRVRRKTGTRGRNEHR